MIAADAMAAIIGKNIGRIKISKTKTLQGLFGFVMTAYILFKVSNIWSNREEIKNDLLLALVCGFAEVWSGDTDNVATLLVYWLANFFIGNLE